MKLNIKFFGLLLLITTVVGCDKNKPYDTLEADAQVHFLNPGTQAYQVVGTPAPAYKIKIGTTDNSDQDRTVTIKITSPTGAVEGTHYTISGGHTLTMRAGQTIDSFSIQGNAAQYTAGRKDTLVIVLDEPSIKAADFMDTIRLVLRGPCFEGDIRLADFLGAYANTREQLGTGAPYGPYRTTISAVNQTSATTGTVTVTNIWDNGWSPITFTLDWTNINARTATVVSQTAIGGSNAGDLNSTYAGQTVAVRPFAGTPGTFSWCNQTLTLTMQLGVTGVGYFASLYTVNMAR